MAYNPNRPPGSSTHRSTPLIARPSSRPNPHLQNASTIANSHPVPRNYLGNMMGGALAGMGYAQTPMDYGYPPPPNPGFTQNSVPSFPQQYQPQAPYYPQQQYPSYPQQHQQPNFPFPPPIPSSSSNHYPSSSSLPQRPATSLAPAPPPASSSHYPQHPSKSARPSGNQPSTYSCQLPECPFTAKNRRVMREHEEDRHLIYEPGREPKPWSGSLKPVDGAVIEGTGIALDTPEAVAKWISDRKKRWPSKKVVEEKEKAREERVKAGLEAPPRERGARGGRGRGGMDARGRGRGRGAYGGDNRGTIRERDESIKAEEPVKKKVKVEDQGEGSDSGSSSDEGSDEEGGPESIATSKEALKALLGDDASDDDDDEDEEGDEGVEEVSSKPLAATETTESEPTTHKQFQVVCRHWRKGHCALGDAECPYLHTIPADQPLPAPKRHRPTPRATPHNPFSRPGSFKDPFSLLEEKDHKHLVSDLLQVVEFLGANDWLRGVEGRVGEMDEESGIEVLKPEEGENLNKGIEVMDQEEEEEEELQEEEPVSHPTVSTEKLVSAPTPSIAPPRLGLVADYASSDEDPDEDLAIKEALLPSSTS